MKDERCFRVALWEMQYWKVAQKQHLKMQFRVLKDNRTFIPIYYIKNQGLRCEDEKPPQHTQGQQEHNMQAFSLIPHHGLKKLDGVGMLETPFQTFILRHIISF